MSQEDINAYYAGSLVQVQATLKSGSTLTDSTSVRLLYRNPGGTVTTKTSTDLTNSSTGVYTFDIAVGSTSIGTWVYWFESTGAVTASYGHQFRVMSALVTT